MNGPKPAWSCRRCSTPRSIRRGPPKTGSSRRKRQRSWLSAIERHARQVLALAPPDRAIPIESAALALEAQPGSERASAERVAEHPLGVRRHKQRIVREHSTYVPELYPPFGLPAKKLDLLS